MIKSAKIILITVTGALLSGQGFAASDPSNLNELLQSVRAERSAIAAQNQQRETEFVQARNQQRAMLQRVQADLAAEERRSAALKEQFDGNETQIRDLEETLTIRLGNLGELKGVVKQVVGDFKGVVDNSLVTAQYPGRQEEINRIASIDGMPKIDDLDQLRILMLEDMVASGNVSKFSASVNSADGEPFKADVVRIGVFNAVHEDKFLRLSEAGTLQELPSQPSGRYRSMAGDLFDANSGVHPMALDPTRGQILGALIQSPTLVERTNQGGPIGYVIIILGIIGVLIALERLLTLTLAGGKIKAQLKNSTPKADNALGRILGVYHENRQVDPETLELKLDEAILKETPKLEKRQAIIKVLAAVAPLLGLLGTVTGMIATFQSITLFGTGDPKLMAGGISTALVTTVLGLVAAIPLVLLHSFVAGKSKALIEILEEQSAGLIAEHSERPPQ
ncbi:MAG: MotA/TolQ/ExbB proton channel family protein [Gammaproteobacteria bacterium]|nr:MotA/TolQ/ExbB proton channel family protein [Gammaproteobacteria bacterium]